MFIEESANTLVHTQTGGRWKMTNNNVLLLLNTYPENQLWFDFVHALFCIYKPPTIKVYKPAKLPKPDRKILLNSKYLMIYIPEMGVEQMVLPFEEAQIASKKMFALLNRNDFPAFHRDMHGHLYATTFTKGIVDGNGHLMPCRARLWVRDNCQGRVAFNNVAIFENRNDYIIALLSGLFFDYREEFYMNRRLPYKPYD